MIHSLNVLAGKISPGLVQNQQLTTGSTGVAVLGTPTIVTQLAPSVTSTSSPGTLLLPPQSPVRSILTKHHPYQKSNLVKSPPIMVDQKTVAAVAAAAAAAASTVMPNVITTTNQNTNVDDSK